DIREPRTASRGHSTGDLLRNRVVSRYEPLTIMADPFSFLPLAAVVALIECFRSVAVARGPPPRARWRGRTELPASAEARVLLREVGTWISVSAPSMVAMRGTSCSRPNDSMPLASCAKDRGADPRASPSRGLPRG